VRRPGRRRLDTSELRETWQPRLWFRLIALVAVLAYATAFVLENRRAVRVHFVFTAATVSLIWFVLLALALGVAGGILLAQLERRRRRRRKKAGEQPDTVGDLGGRDEAEGKPQ
jgi:uncharacterized integral membrane protein